MPSHSERRQLGHRPRACAVTDSVECVLHVPHSVLRDRRREVERCLVVRLMGVSRMELAREGRGLRERSAWWYAPVPNICQRAHVVELEYAVYGLVLRDAVELPGQELRLLVCNCERGG